MKDTKPNNDLMKIRIWRVAFYSLITLGIYMVVWFVKRHRELGESRPRAPHWIILLSVMSMMMFGFIGLLVFAYMEPDTQRGAEVFVYGLYGITLFVTIGYVWWFSRYALIIARAVQAPLSRPLVISLAIFFTPALMLMLQYAINRPAAMRPDLSQRFLYISALTIALSLGSTISQYIQQPVSKEISLFAQELETTKRTVSEQRACLDAVADRADVDAVDACFETN